MVNIIIFLDVQDFILSAACKLWSECFEDENFLKRLAMIKWGVNFNLDKNKIRDYIFTRYRLENLPLRLFVLCKNYADKKDMKLFPVLKSLMSQEEFYRETQDKIFEWLNNFSVDCSVERNILINTFKKRLYLEEYDIVHSQFGNQNGEGWNGSYRIYNNDGYYIILYFRCFSYPSQEKEELHLYAKVVEKGYSKNYKIIDTRDQNNFFCIESIIDLRDYLSLEKVSLVSFFCFFLYCMGKLIFHYNFACLHSEQFTVFWNNLENTDKGITL